MAAVWIARMRGKHGFERIVAIKTILAKYASDPTFQKMFLDEARIASRIEHVNVAQTLDLGEQHGTLFIVMECVDGEALTKLLGAVSKQGSKVPVGIILRILADTCGGLHAAHELRGSDGALLGVIHRDISPQNILLTSRGVAKLIDFGIAKAKGRISEETSAGFVKGKIKYMAPEQAIGREVDRRADVWAIGAILYRTLAGRPAYSGDNELEVLHALTSGKPPLPLPTNVPAPIASVTLRALAHDSARRFATAADLQAALEQAMVDAGVTTTTSDVQAFVALHLPDQAATRKRTLDLALEAAKDRERMSHLLKPVQHDSSSGILDVGSHVLPVGATFARRAPELRGIPPAPPPPRGSAPPHSDEAERTVPLMPGAASPLWLHPNLATPQPAPVHSDETIESLAVMSRAKRRQRLMIVVVAAVGALAAVMLVAIAATQTNSSGHAVATTTLAAWSKGLRAPQTATPAPEPTPATTSVDPPLALAATTAAAPPKAPAATPMSAPRPPAPKPAPARKPRADDGF